jgi:hypothetical protein
VIDIDTLSAVHSRPSFVLASPPFGANALRAEIRPVTNLCVNAAAEKKFRAAWNKKLVASFSAWEFTG